MANRIENAVARYRAEQEVKRGYDAIEAASDGIALLDVEGEFTYVNHAFADHYGYTRVELAGRHWEFFHDEAEVQRFYDEIIPEVVSVGRWIGRTTGKRKDGNSVLEDHTITLTEADTTICVVRDITAKRVRHQALAEELSFLDDALNELNDIFYIFDDEGTFLWWNDHMNRVTGYTDDELADLSPIDFVREQDRERLTASIETVNETGSSRVEAELLTADGTTIPYEFYSSELTDSVGGLIGRVGIGRDISTRKEYEWEFHRQNDRLDEFAGILSHDQKPPHGGHGLFRALGCRGRQW